MIASSAYVKIVDLLTDDEWADACATFGCALLTKSAFKAAPSTLFQRVSKTTYAMTVLGKVAPLVRMLGDVVRFLQRGGVHARTTNSIVVLSDEFQLTQQQFDLATKWSEEPLRSIDASQWSDLENDLQSTIRPLLLKLCAGAKPEIDHEEEDIVEAYSENPFETPEAREWTEATYSEKTLAEFKDVLSLLSSAVPSSDGGAGIFEPPFIARLDGLIRRLKRQHQEFKYEISQAKYRHGRSPAGLMPPEQEALRIFVEKLKFLAEWERRDGFADLLQIDIFRHRPQLYEVWTLCSILAAMANGGFDLDLCKTFDDGYGGKRWELKYAKASRPVARLTRASDRDLFLFYQLFRKRGGGDMPDISMWDNVEATGNAIWVVDPKLSEKRAYTAQDYTRTAERYRSKFRPLSFCTIVEYFPRPDISVSASDAILDVRPGGVGLQTLLDRLRSAHNLGPLRVAVIDVSSSFTEKLAAAASELSDPRWGVLSDRFVTFADDATVRSGLRAALNDGGKSLKSMAGGGTELEPLLRTMRKVQAEAGGEVQFVVVSDFNFGAASESDLRASGLRVEAVKL